MHEEAAFVESDDERDYLVYFMKADDIDAVYKVFEEKSPTTLSTRRTKRSCATCWSQERTPLSTSCCIT
ncbi:hypothetical protein [Halogranum rubrum]|uniref:Uncharacterized protein n=1 Tax=Halogranum salarium B-1 TaxID=1210908 RepID=J3JEM3_9EURY|nr:hypothetical protein [Halogranum salarium]EJN58484.1 hypothetical protein HSB1_29620 [Halogranum salarium B-1]